MKSIFNLSDAVALGLLNHVQNVWQRRTARHRGSPGFALRSRYARHPVYCRAASSDESVFNSILKEKEYRGIDAIADADVIIDCGANIGCTSAYCLSRFPAAQLIAVEPDSDTFAVLQRNLAPYGSRATAVHAGVWSHPSHLRVATQSYRNGSHVTRQVEECIATDAGALRGMDIRTLLASTGRPRISLLKIDIEGAEAVVFGGRCEWLDQVDHLIIELHDDSHFGPASEIFHRAIAGRGFQVTTDGLTTICRR